MLREQLRTQQARHDAAFGELKAEFEEVKEEMREELGREHAKQMQEVLRVQEQELHRKWQAQAEARARTLIQAQQRLQDQDQAHSQSTQALPPAQPLQSRRGLPILSMVWTSDCTQGLGVGTWMATGTATGV